MPCITEEYREINRKLHKDPVYGSSGHVLAKDVLIACKQYQTLDVLDYGCGKRGLEGALGFSIQNYDPCIEGFDAPPQPADIVACGDVLEHIEPECLDAVLADLYRLTKKCLVINVATRPARKILPDGRNAHLIQEGPSWWLPKLWGAGFRIITFRDGRNQGVSIAFTAVLDKEP